MLYEDALKLYLNKHPDSHRLISNIMNWNQDKTIMENAVAMGISHCGAYRFMLKYNLSCKQGLLGRRMKK